MVETCGDNRFEIIESAKKRLCIATNIEDSPNEWAVIDSILFRMWQMGWLPGCERAERTCKMVPKVLSDDGIITHVAFNCGACGKGRNFPTYVDFTDKIGTAKDVIRTHATVGYCEDCGAKVVK